MTARAPGEELWQGKVREIACRLLDDQIVDNSQIGCGEAKLREHQIDAVQPECELIPEPAHVCLFEAGTVGDHEGALASVNILERREAANALPPPGMEIGSRQLREPTERVLGRAREVP